MLKGERLVNKQQEQATTKRRMAMRKLVAIGMGVALMAGVAQADLLVQYSFNDGEDNTVAATTLADNLSASDVTLSTGNITFGTFQATTWAGSGVPYAQGTGGWTEDTLGESKYWEFTLTADAEFTFSLDTFSFYHRATAAGPQDLGVVINGTTIQTFSSSTDTVFYSTALTGFNDLESAVVRIHGWTAEGTQGTGDFRVDDFALQGSVIPEPGTLALLGLGAAFLGFVRRKTSKS